MSNKNETAVSAATLTMRETAEYLGVSYATANELSWREGFPVIQVGRKKLVPKNALDAWLLEQRRTY